MSSYRLVMTPTKDEAKKKATHALRGDGSGKTLCDLSQPEKGWRDQEPGLPGCIKCRQAMRRRSPTRAANRVMQANGEWEVEDAAGS